MAITNGYVTQAAFKTFASLSSSTHNDDIDRAIEAASRAVDRFCGRRFYLDGSTSARYYTAHPTEIIWLPVDEIATATGLVVKTDDNWDGTYENTWTADDRDGPYGFMLEPVNAAPYTRLRALAEPWPTVPKGIEVTAKWGYPAVPTDIVEATLILAGRLFKRKDSPFGIMGQEGTGILTIPRIDPDVKGLLAPWVRMDQVGR